ADVLVAQHALARFELDDAVDQQERIAMRQHPPDFGDFDRHGHGCGHQSSLSRAGLPWALTLRASVSSCRKRAAFLRHSRLGISGVPAVSSPGSWSELVTRLIAVITTRSQSSRWPRMPAAPPTRQLLPTVAMPATAAQPATAVCAP